jgi:sensor domain DACNV-containing protein
MPDPTYPTARAIAGHVSRHFANRIEAAAGQGRTPLAPAPDEAAVETLIDAAFWTSLRREEGVTPRISLAFLPPHLAGQPLTFETQLPLRPAALTKVAPAVERPGIHLGVWPLDGRLAVWGTTRSLPAYCLVVEVVASGLLVVKDRREPFGKFMNVAVLEGDVAKIVDDRPASGPDCPGIVRSLLGVEWPVVGTDTANALVQLAVSMRAHGRGGAMLVVPAGSATWQDSIVSPILYAVHPPFSDLADLLARAAAEMDDHEWQEDYRRSVDALAGLTAVDGAVLATDRYDLLAFGAKIQRRRGSNPVERVMVTEPILGAETTIAAPTELGGTRHLSAAQFAHDQQDAVALVASQDGRVTVFKWSPSEQMVHAHRVEALLV